MLCDVRVLPGALLVDELPARPGSEIPPTGSVGAVTGGIDTPGSWPTTGRLGVALTPGSCTEMPPLGGLVATTILPTHWLLALIAIPADLSWFIDVEFSG